jgi:hypothetical protein
VTQPTKAIQKKKGSRSEREKDKLEYISMKLFDSGKYSCGREFLMALLVKLFVLYQKSEKPGICLRIKQK